MMLDPRPLQRTACAAVFVILVPFAAARAQPEPAQQLQVFAPMLGAWQGEGQVSQGAGAEPLRWKSTSVCEWILGGHVLQQDMHVVFAAGEVADVVMRVFYTYDRDRSRYRVLRIANTGVVKHADLHVVGPGRFVYTILAQDQGQPNTQRWVLGCADEELSLGCDLAVGDGAFFRQIEGTAKRVEQAVIDIAAAQAFVPPPAETVALHALAGDYTLEAVVRSSADAPPLAVRGSMVGRAVLGGAVFELRENARTPQGKVEALHYMAWDPVAGEYAHLGLNNMGFAGAQPGYRVDDAIVFGSVARVAGQPMVNQTVLTLAGDGGLARTRSTALQGLGEAFVNFSATYARR